MRLPAGNELVPYESPYHVTQIALLLLKEFFGSLPEGHPYHFSHDYEHTGILFDTAYNKAAGIWGKKPIITVGRGSQSTSVAVLGDLTGKHLPLGSRTGTNLVQSSVDVRVVSKSRAECEILSELVFGRLLMMRTLLPRLCGVHMVHDISMTPAQQFEQDDTCYEVDLTMQYSMQYKWDHGIPVQLLAGTEPKINSVRFVQQPLDNKETQNL